MIIIYKKSYVSNRGKSKKYVPSRNKSIFKTNSDFSKKKGTYRDVFPKKFPFWARLKINKNRTTLVIDEEDTKDKKNNFVPGFVHRESIHGNKSNRDYEMIFPNPDVDDKEPMYLKRPSKLPQKLFKPHNKKLNMPQHLIDRYDKNNKKNKK